MKFKHPKTASLGDLIVTAFDQAAQYSSDPVEISRLATQAVQHMISHPQRVSGDRPAVVTH
jgi:hypothetical protein